MFHVKHPEEQADVICGEIHRLQGLHDETLNLRGEAYLWRRLGYQGEITGLRKALCALFDWPLSEACLDGQADQYVQQWPMFHVKHRKE